MEESRCTHTTSGWRERGAVSHQAEDRASSSDKRHGDSTTYLVHGNLCYGVDLEGEGGDYRCSRMGSFCNGDDDCSGYHRVSIAPHWLCNGSSFKDIYLSTVCVFVWSVHGALLLPTIRGLPLCVFVHIYGVLLVPVCMHSDYEPHHNINVQFECADYICGRHLIDLCGLNVDRCP